MMMQVRLALYVKRIMTTATMVAKALKNIETFVVRPSCTISVSELRRDSKSPVRILS